MSRFYSKERTHSVYRSGILFVLLTLTACTHSTPEDAERAKQLKKLGELETENAILEGKVKDAGNDPGLRYNLVNDQELLKSRIERMKENLHVTGGTHAAPEGGEGKAGAHKEAAH